MLKNQSVATIAAPQFINIEPYNPLISQCEIKVLYVGENRNGSYISEDVAMKMANSLPGTPIVAAFKPEKEDFGTHEKYVTIEENGEIEFSCRTVPYGFVAPDAKVWFKDFIDTDEFGAEVERKYLMTNGYLWTGQFPEIENVLKEGQPQSMELDEETLSGQWALNHNSNIEFFIINDAVFSKLCILGSDVEPCFEGASVTGQQVSKDFTKNSEFMTTLFSMMNELKDALQYSKGGSDMHKKEQVDTLFEEGEGAIDSTESNADTTAENSVEPATDETVTEEPMVTLGAAPAVDGKESAEDIINNPDSSEEEAFNASVESGITSDASQKKQDFVKQDDDKDDDKDDTDPDDSVENPDDDDEDDEKKVPANHALEVELAETKASLAEAQAELESLRAFKLGIENQQKDALIAKYHMLSDEDKAEIIEHKTEFTLDEIDAKLALLYVKKNVDFSTLTGEAEEAESASEKSPITTFSLDAAVDLEVPGIVKALRAAK